MNKRLLILGTLGEFEQLVQKARARGIYTIVCDGYPDGPARAFADESYVIPVTDTDRIAALCKEKQVDGILTSFSDLLLECMVKISAKAGLPCYLNPEQLPWYRDKSATRGLLEELGLPSPGFAKIPTSGLAPELIAHLHFPLVTKPLDKYGSRGIYVVHNLEELKQAIDKAATTGDKYQFIDPVFDLTDELEQCETPFDAVRPILELIESSPNIDFGGPGPLGSFMEKFYHEGYEEELVASLKRKPTEYTIALMFRIIADKKNPNLSEYKHLLKTLDSTSEIDTFWLDEIAKL